ncbi:hypothetical protein B0T16DRAFT_423355 [Cercophora newfieldiana]|uniref:Uncharacterized protein n=1 Tax=Cercophora newfieldiana TaxID=92897 RepID=A0AA39XUW7_9PEZI|nr:hypothetical protein B0T16DRAFT_423355 [Cercophora newfieldiana]
MSSQPGTWPALWDHIDESNTTVSLHNPWPENPLVILNHIVVPKDATKDTEQKIQRLLQQHAMTAIFKPSKWGSGLDAPLFQIMRLDSPDIRSCTPDLDQRAITTLLDCPVVERYLMMFVDSLSNDERALDYAGFIKVVAPCLAVSERETKKLILSPEDPRRYRARTRKIQWLQDPERVTVKDQIWIFYHILYLFQEAGRGFCPFMRIHVAADQREHSSRRFNGRITTT